MKRKRSVWLGALLWAAAPAVGCGSCDRQAERPAEPETEKSAEEAEEPSGPEVGTVEGVVRLAEDEKLPEFSREGLNEKVDVERPDTCPPPKQAEVRPVRLGEGRGLDNVLVSATGFSEAPPHEPTDREVVIRDCRLQPPVVVGLRGDDLVVRNESDHPFFPRIGADPFMEALIKGQSRAIELERGGSYPLRCGMGAACGRTDVVVLYHPVYDLSGEGGSFRIDNVPAGQEVTLHAWHPLFEEASAKVEVAPGETERLELVLEPADRVIGEPPPADDEEGASEAASEKPGSKGDAPEQANP
ncbi:MAG: carboxypeptidase-like regulatory domain-containing protein [Myxococcota bacterium]